MFLSNAAAALRVGGWPGAGSCAALGDHGSRVAAGPSCITKVGKRQRTSEKVCGGQSGIVCEGIAYLCCRKLYLVHLRPNAGELLVNLSTFCLERSRGCLGPSAEESRLMLPLWRPEDGVVLVLWRRICCRLSSSRLSMIHRRKAGPRRERVSTSGLDIWSSHSQSH